MNRSRRQSVSNRLGASTRNRSVSRLSPNRSVRMSPNRSVRSPGRQMSPNRSVRSGTGSLARSSRSSLASTRTTPAVVPMTSEEMLNRLPVKPSPQQKLKLVFEQLDVGSEQRVGLDGFRRTLKLLNFSFTQATIEDLYEQMDVDKKGGIDFSEFLNFAATFPILVEAIYSRARELFAHAASEDNLAFQREVLEGCQTNERILYQQWEVAKEELENEMQSFQALEEDLQQQKQALKAAGKDAVEAGRTVDLKRSEMLVKERDMIEAKEFERESLKPLQDAEKNVALAEERLEGAEQKIDELREQERQLEAQLDDVKREITKQSESVSQCSDQLVELKEHAEELKTVLEEAQRELDRVSEIYKEANLDFCEAKQQNEIADQTKDDLYQLVKQLGLALADSRTGLVPFRQRDEHQKNLHKEAKQLLEAEDNQLQKLEAEMAASDAQRAASEAQENALLENEVRLREQRRNVNLRDALLSNEAGKFLVNQGRSDTREVTAQLGAHGKRKQ